MEKKATERVEGGRWREPEKGNKIQSVKRIDPASPV
jgi:hypothetical protein